MEELTVDHLTPRAQGGQSRWGNCVLACVECNNRKAARDMRRYDGRSDGRDGPVGSVYRAGDPGRRADRVGFAAGHQEVAGRQQLADGQGVCDLSGENERFDASGLSNRAGGVF